MFPDGRKIVCATSEKTLQLWEAATPDQLAAWREEARSLAERMKARAREREAEEEREHAIQLSGEGGIKQWLVLAPIPLEHFPERRLTFEHIPCENLFRPKAGDHLRVGGQELIWREAALTNYVIDFSQVIGHPEENCVGYAVTYLYTPRAVSGLRMRVGMDDAGIIFLNGQRIHQWTVRAAFKLDRDTVTDISLNAGVNVLVFKVMNGPGHWLGSIRLTDSQGNPATNIVAMVKPSK